MSSALDDFTPAEVWREYEARKAKLEHAEPWRYHEELARILEELGCGIDPDELTLEQATAQLAAVEKWQSKGAGCRP